MRRFRRHTVLLALVFSTAILLSPAPFACGPFFAQPIFTTLIHPDAPIEKYASGKLGLLQPSYARVYLYIAYRHLSGHPFTPAEGKAVVSYWEPDPMAGPRPPGKNRYGWDKEWSEYWFEVSGQLPAISKTRQGKPPLAYWNASFRAIGYHSYLNCQEDAYRMAVLTLQERKKQFGEESKEFSEWATGQDTVFQNCGSDSAQPIVPRAAKPEWPALLRADRTYQVAAAHFYSGSLDTAQNLFEGIADDAGSPWQSWGDYLAARCLIRKASFADDPAVQRKWLQEAESRLHAIVANPDLRQRQATARRLLGYVRFRLFPRERGQELAANLLSPRFRETRRQDLIDYKTWLDFVRGEGILESLPGLVTQAEAASAVAELRKKSAMTDWILTFQENDPQSLDHALARWKESNSALWLVPALSKIRAAHLDTGALLAASEKIPADSPAYYTVAYHRIRILMESTQHEQARNELDRILEASQELPRSARNSFLAVRMKLARNLDEFMRFAPRQTAGVSDDGLGEAWQTPSPPQNGQPSLFFDADASRILTEKLPLAALHEMARAPAWPEHLRREVVLAAWTRAILLDDLATAASLHDAVTSVAPDLGPLLAEFQKAPLHDEKRFAAAFLLLKSPGMRPFVAAGFPRGEKLNRLSQLRDNWWCSVAPREDNWLDYYRMWVGMRGPLGELYAKQGPGFPDFLTPQQINAAQDEWQKLASLEGAANFLGKIVLDWARAHPDDSRVPEALHRVVRATRLGCTDANTGRYSHSAFRLLHRKYPKSEWAVKTPYWYSSL